MVASDDTDFLREGTRLDRYEKYLELLGAGGMGRVYRAHDATLSRDVVIKTLVDKSEEFIRRFMREASVMAKLIHQNVVQILDYRVSEGGQPFIVMPYLRGQDLAQRLKQGPMEIGEAVDMVLGVCAGVFACHRRGIIHRDIKPRNVFLAETEDYGTVVKVLDFGVARLSQNSPSDELTSAGTVIGTPKYMAPEQVKREEADERTDQYGIGVLLYSASTRRTPFGKLDGLDLVRAILKGNYPSPREHRPDICEELGEVIERAMQAEREGRFPSVHELGRALLPFATAEGRSLWTGHFTTAPRPMVGEDSTPHRREAGTKDMAEVAGATKGPSAAKLDVPSAVDPERRNQDAPVRTVSTGTTLLEASSGQGVAAPMAPPPAPVESSAASLRPDAAIGGQEEVDVVPPVPVAVEEVVGSGGQPWPVSSTNGPVGKSKRRRRAVGLVIALGLIAGAGSSWLLTRATAPNRASGLQPGSELPPGAPAPEPTRLAVTGTVQNVGMGFANAMPESASAKETEHAKTMEQTGEAGQSAAATRGPGTANVPPEEPRKKKSRPRKSAVHFTPDGWPILE